jgi:hypothetical protein
LTTPFAKSVAISVEPHGLLGPLGGGQLAVAVTTTVTPSAFFVVTVTVTVDPGAQGGTLLPHPAVAYKSTLVGCVPCGHGVHFVAGESGIETEPGGQGLEGRQAGG